MNENHPLIVADEAVEFDKQPVEFQEFRKTTDCLTGIYGIYLKLIKPKYSNMELVELETLGC